MGNHPTNPNFQKEGFWNPGDYILDKYYPIGGVLNGHHPDFYEYFDILNYVGIKDDDCQELCEGDIVSFGNETQTYEGVVSYHAPSFVAEVFHAFLNKDTPVKIRDTFYVSWKKRGADAFFDGFYYDKIQLTGWNFLKILGNIFENEDLLNTK